MCPGGVVPRAAQQILYYYATSSFTRVGVAWGCGVWVWHMGVVCGCDVGVVCGCGMWVWCMGVVCVCSI